MGGFVCVLRLLIASVGLRGFGLVCGAALVSGLVLCGSMV